MTQPFAAAGEVVRQYESITSSMSDGDTEIAVKVTMHHVQACI